MNAMVNESIKNIDCKIDKAERHGDEENPPLNDRVIPHIDGLEHKSSYPGDEENCLRDDRPPQQHAKLYADK